MVVVTLMMATPTKHLSAFNVPHNILQINLLDLTLLGPPHPNGIWSVCVSPYSTIETETVEGCGRQQLITSSNSNVRALLLWFYDKNRKLQKEKSLKASCQQASSLCPQRATSHRAISFLPETNVTQRKQSINNIDSYSY